MESALRVLVAITANGGGLLGIQAITGGPYSFPGIEAAALLLMIFTFASTLFSTLVE